jgi:undecaprenyl-diphosphatase
MLKTFVQSVTLWDTMVTVRIFHLNTRKWVDSTMYWLSRSGDGYGYGLFALILLIIDLETALRILPLGLAAFIPALLLQKVIKTLVKRDRPCTGEHIVRSRIKPPDRYSFPSGHAAGSFLMALLISSVWTSLSIPLLLWATLVGISRVYNGVHYPTDVIVGSIIGMTSIHFFL